MVTLLTWHIFHIETVHMWKISRPISKSKRIRLVVQQNHRLTAQRGIQTSQLHHICISHLTNISRTSLPICQTRNLIDNTHQLRMLCVPLSLQFADPWRCSKLIKQYMKFRCGSLFIENVGGMDEQCFTAYTW